ncbi:MAG: hypothetical protein R2856_39885 [Caldilineaceae bacterium]
MDHSTTHLLYAVSQSNPAPSNHAHPSSTSISPYGLRTHRRIRCLCRRSPADELRQYNNMPDEMKGSLIYVGMR